jgi:uncharacterized protein YqgC (DUF456 family)
MIYTAVVLVIGIYLGQEYTIIPSIKIMLLGMLSYLKQIQEQAQAKEADSSTTTTTEYIVNKYFDFLWKPKQE